MDNGNRNTQHTPIIVLITSNNTYVHYMCVFCEGGVEFYCDGNDVNVNIQQVHSSQYVTLSSLCKVYTVNTHNNHVHTKGSSFQQSFVCYKY